MKISSTLMDNSGKAYAILIISLISVIGACKKDRLPAGEIGAINSPVRQVRYELYTNEDFAGNTKNIRFSLFMRMNTKTIFDSSLTTMRIKDIPDSIHRIIIEKSVPGNDPSNLTVGFNYEIENVGNSWFLEPFPMGDSLKVLRYSFR
jgi:hypothetical protein